MSWIELEPALVSLAFCMFASVGRSMADSQVTRGGRQHAGRVHKSVLRSKEGNTWESYRYVEGGVMVVKSVYIGADGNR